MDEDRNTQTTEVRETRTRDLSGRVVVKRVVWYVAGVIIALLALRIILLLLAANQGNGFVDFIYNLSNVFAAPFYGIFNYTPHYGKFYFEISSVVAIIIYALVAWGITELLDIGRRRGEVE